MEWRYVETGIIDYFLAKHALHSPQKCLEFRTIFNPGGLFSAPICPELHSKSFEVSV
jgi:hypothetical protein